MRCGFVGHLFIHTSFFIDLNHEENEWGSRFLVFYFPLVNQLGDRIFFLFLFLKPLVSIRTNGFPDLSLNQLAYNIKALTWIKTSSLQYIIG